MVLVSGISGVCSRATFPTDKVSHSYNVMYNAFKPLSRDYSATERAALFHDNAARVWGINEYFGGCMKVSLDSKPRTNRSK